MQQVDVLVNEVPRLNFFKLCQKVSLGLVPQTIARGSKHIENDIVDLELDLFTLFPAGVPYHIDFAFQDVSLVE